MIQFSFEDNIYTYIPFKDLRPGDLPEASRAYKSRYLDLDCAFDIETSSDQDRKLSWMYMWQFAINDITIIGRTWPEFVELMKMLRDKYANEKEYRILAWIHNASYEWSFMKNWLKFAPDRYGDPQVFALDPREVIKIVTAYGVEFRDSSVLTNVKLGKLAIDYKTGLTKLTEAIDYDEVLTPVTPLDNPRIAYAINDVQILAKFNHYYIKPYYMKKGHDIPLTSTAIPRNEMKRNFKKLSKAERNKHKNRIRNSFPTQNTYEIIMRWLFRGGYVHASIADVFQKFVNMDMWSLDFKSSYPAVMLHELYPWRFIKKNTKYFYIHSKDYKWMHENAFYARLRFKNIRSKTSHSIESKHKIIDYKNGYFDNGRLVGADMIDVLLTEQDWLNYLDFYSWDEVKCISYNIASKEPLPKFLLDMILEYFSDKEKLDRDSLDYVLQKSKLNSLYGMTVSGLFHKSLVLNDEGILEPGEYERDYDDVVRSQLLLPWWGIWVCAYARRNILKICAKLDTDNAYSDTDSSKVFNYYGNKYVFDNYNDRIARMNKNMYVGEYDRKIFMKLGMFCLEDKYIKFQTNGCKRYIYTTADYDKKTKKYHLVDHVTISGMRKGTLQAKAEKEGKDIYDLFKDGLELNKLEADKLTSCYTDTEFSLDVTDYQGREAEVIERSCVTLVKIGFQMSIEKEFLNLYYQFKEREKLIFGERW